jgi:hypothetical protein
MGEGSVITGKGEVNNENFEKLQTSIENLSIEADDERDEHGKSVARPTSKMREE